LLTDRPLHQSFLTANPQVISLVTIFGGRQQVLAWAGFRKFGKHLIFLKLIMIKISPEDLLTFWLS
jgi:hypothetical protein